jgi:signal transduction histidine kinase
VTPRRIDLRADAAIAVVVFALSLGLLAAGDTDLGEYAGDVDALGVALTALASLPLVARRIAPLPVFACTALAGAVLQLVAAPAGPPIGATVALYSVAAGTERSRMTLAVVAAAFVAHIAATGLATGAFPGTEALLGAAVWGGAWLLGDRMQRDRRLAAAEERMRIARDLHDSAGHAINVILVHAGLGRLRSERDDPAGARAAFETIEDVARETIGEIDELVTILRADGGDGVEPPAGVTTLERLVERHRAAGLDVTAAVRGEQQPLSAAVDRGAYRIAQEALTNAARHGDGSARLDIHFGAGTLEMTVTSALRRGRVAGPVDGHGVTGMRERAALLGGSLRAGPRGGRFEVHARLPLDGRPA